MHCIFKGAWAFSLAAGLAACGHRLGPPPGMAAAPAAEAPAASGEAAAREQYVSRAMTETHPAAGGRRLASDGTGFFIAPDKVLTNFHVAGACGALTVGNGTEGDETAANLIAGDPGLDLAVLQTAARPAEAARFAMPVHVPAPPGFAVVGYPERGLPVREAEILAVMPWTADLVSDVARYRFDGSVRRGNSGSPVLDETGAVVGVVVMKIDTVAVYQKTGLVVDNIGIAISNRTVADFLHAHGLDPETAPAGPSLEPPQLLDKAHGFVRQIGCWK